MGVAGGLVPSPSALLVLLSAVALTKTWFGVLLVFGYGVGMAMTLAAVGLLLVRMRNRMWQMVEYAEAGRVVTRVVATLPLFTALLVLGVGFGTGRSGNCIEHVVFLTGCASSRRRCVAGL